MGSKHKNKRTGVTHERPRPGWTNAEIDFVLNEILPLNDPKRLHAVECRIAEQLDRGRKLTGVTYLGRGHSYKPIDLLIWKLASAYGRAAKYIPDLLIRNRREGLPFTWMEKRIIHIAFDPGKDAQKAIGRPPPSSAYLGLILGRPPLEIVQARVLFTTKIFSTGGFNL